MIQKILITIFFIFIFIFSMRFIKKIKTFSNEYNTKKSNDKDVVDLEKDPDTNEYKPKK